MLDAPNRPTALIVANNLMALGALKAIRARGLRIPDELALVGIDDPQWAELVEPPLTVVAQPTREMAEAAVALLLERVTRERSDPRKLVFLFKLVVRGSSGGPAAQKQAQPFARPQGGDVLA
jgi:DNA-binding LacI/PurR family transcriptional regulator